MNDINETDRLSQLIKQGDEFKSQGNFRAAASTYDQAYGLAPENKYIDGVRKQLLDQLAVTEHGIHFRYIPAGTFLMGSDDGEPDEQPVHPVNLHDYWLSETPISWAKFCELMDFQPPPIGLPDDYWEQRQSVGLVSSIRELIFFRWGGEHWIHFLHGHRQICLQYCENETIRAKDWHNHLPDYRDEYPLPDDLPPHILELARAAKSPAQRENPQRPFGYDEKPMVSVPYEGAQALGLRISTPSIQYRLPTEAEWEKAARGGLVGEKYSWGDEAPSAKNCDFDRFSHRSVQKMKTFPPNDYGLYAMCGSVWEWVCDWYDSQYYSSRLFENPQGPTAGEEYVLRGGSWTDDAPAVTVSFRMSGRDASSPNIGFRLCRVDLNGKSQISG